MPASGLKLEVGALKGAGHGEKSAERLAQRNGYRERDGQTREGTPELRLPKPRKGSYFPGFLKPRRMSCSYVKQVLDNRRCVLLY